ncbi:MAG: hypothetical protein AAB425_15805, partial [Bdellovibrionota bacterium]
WFTGLKINVSELLVHLSILLFMGMVLYGKAGARVAYPALFDGLRLGIMVAIGLGFFGIASIFIKGFSHGTDTALGFAYFDRLKSTFNSPDAAGLFYAASIPILAWVAADAPAGSWRRRIALVGLASLSVLIVATGSRTARLASLVPLAACFAHRPLRGVLYRVLPVFLLVFYFGFFHRSLPAVLAAHGFTGPMEEAGFVSSFVYPNSSDSVAQSFLRDDGRAKLMRETLDAWPTDALTFLAGIGPGLSGLNTLGFPSPHNLIEIAIEQGIIGFSLFVAAFLLLMWRLMRLFLSADVGIKTAAICLLSGLAVIAIGSLTWKNQNWFFCWLIFVTALAVAREGEKRIALPERLALKE